MATLKDRHIRSYSNVKVVATSKALQHKEKLDTLMIGNTPAQKHRDFTMQSATPLRGREFRKK